MALAEKIAADTGKVFINPQQFGRMHTWNGQEFLCVTDDEVALKRKNYNVVDVSWDNNTTETVVYVGEREFPGRAQPNEHGFFDNRAVKILQVQNDCGMLAILVVSNEAKAVGNAY